MDFSIWFFAVFGPKTCKFCQTSLSQLETQTLSSLSTLARARVCNLQTKTPATMCWWVFPPAFFCVLLLPFPLPLLSFPFLPLSSSFMCCARTKAPEHFVRQKVSLNQFWELFMSKFRLCRVCFSVGFSSFPNLSFPLLCSRISRFVCLLLRPSWFF